MNKIKAISVWWYAHIPRRTEVNFHRQGGKIGQYQRVTPSSRERLGNILFSQQFSLEPRVSIGAFYTRISYDFKEQS